MLTSVDPHTHTPVRVCHSPLELRPPPHLKHRGAWLRYCLKQDLKPPEFSPVNNKVIGLSYFFKVPFLHQGAMIVE